VPPRLRAEIEREHGRLMLVSEQLAKLKKPSAPAPLTPAAAEMARRKEMLLRVKSLGPAFSSRLTNEVFYKDFRNRREVGGHFGLGGSSGAAARPTVSKRSARPAIACPPHRRRTVLAVAHPPAR
jgi:transposase